MTESAQVGRAKGGESTTKSPPGIDTRKARVCFPDGRVTHYAGQKLAYALWLALPMGIRAAFRGANDARPVYPWDLSASIYKLLGIDPHGRLPHPQGCVAYVSPLAGGNVQSGGLLTEIM